LIGFRHRPDRGAGLKIRRYNDEVPKGTETKRTNAPIVFTGPFSAPLWSVPWRREA